MKNLLNIQEYDSMIGRNSQGVVMSYKYIKFELFHYITIADLDNLTNIINNAIDTINFRI